MSVDARPTRSRTAVPTTRSARVAVAILSALALVLGLAPAASAQSVSSRLVDFTFAGSMNSGGSVLQPGGHVRLDIKATNTHGTGALGLSTRVLNTYGFVMPTGFTARSSGGSHMTNTGNHDQSNYFGGQPGGVTSSARRVGRDDSRSGWLSYNIPQNAQGGSSHSFRVKAHIGTGGSWHGPASETLTFTLPAVATTTQAISVTPTTGRVGENVTLSTRVSANHGTNTPTGTVRFNVDGQTLTANVVNGVATTTASFSTAGSKPVTATYLPGNTSQWSGSSRTGTVSIQTEATQTNLTLDPVEVLAGGTVQASASVNPAGAQGEIEFSAGGEPIRVPVGADGTATTELPADTSGEMTVTATFIPADPQRYTQSSDSRTVDVYEQTSTSTEVTVDADPVQAGEETTLTAAITPDTAAGTVTFTIDEQTYPVQVANGIAALDHTFTTTGEHPVTADFTPTNTDRYLPSTGQATVNVEAEGTQTALTLDPVEVTAGGTIQATATVTPADAEGEIEFTAGETTVNVPVDASGTAAADIPVDAAGQMTVTATFVPTNPDRYSSSSDSQTVEIDSEPTQTDLTLDATEVFEGETVRASASVKPGSAAGEIEFTAGETTIRVPVGTDGTATADLPITTAGPLSVTATFIPANPDRYSGSSDSQTVNVLELIATSTSLTASTDPARAGQQTTLTATVTPAGTAGTVTFTIDGHTYSADVTDGLATLDHTFMTAGDHVVVVNFTPTDTNRYLASSGQATVSVEAEATQTDLTLNPIEVTAGGEVTATAQITPSDAAGQVRFDYGEQTQTVTVTEGKASTTFAAPSAGTGTITATFIPTDTGRYSGSSDLATVNVETEATQTDLTLAPVEVTVGGHFTASANITPADAAGQVRFDFGEQTQTVTVTEGVATAEFATTLSGTGTVTATFLPTDPDRYSSSTDTQTVEVHGEVVAQPTSVEVDAGSAEAGEEVVLTATVNPAHADGEVRFTVDGVEHLVPVVDGVANLVHVAGERGSYTVRAEFIPADPEAYDSSHATETLVVGHDEGPGTDPGTDPGTPNSGSLSLVGLIGSIGIGVGLHSSGSLASLGS